LWIEGLPPLWWIPANVSAIYSTGVAAVFALRHIGGWKAALLMVFASPLLDAAFTTLSGFPSMVAVNSPFPFWLTQLCGIATYAIAIYTMHIVIRLVAKDSPSSLIDYSSMA
jgi:ascorbate-specific PTS system EIIC-type component UlaA